MTAPPPRPMRGLHHVTALASAPQPTLDFRAVLLGRRLVKRTVNFEDPAVPHLYLGDATGAPGSLLTFFTPSDAGRGRAGPGMATAVAWAAPPDARSPGRWRWPKRASTSTDRSAVSGPGPSP